jgi:hypothetical protein
MPQAWCRVRLLLRERLLMAQLAMLLLVQLLQLHLQLQLLLLLLLLPGVAQLLLL